MSDLLLSAAMIVRDEERHLPDCLGSLQGVVDEIVVVDTGSVDGTVAIAESFGARVLHHPWAGDFSEARNVGLGAARGRWILYIDADERLRPAERGAVESLLEDADEIAFRLRLCPLVGWTPYLEYRLWRNDPRIRFEGVIHEKIVFALQAVASAEGRAIGECALTLDHVGYEGDQTHKHLRNLPLLEAQLDVEPENVFNWVHLGRVFAGLHRSDEAAEALERAVGLARERPNEHGGVAFSELVSLRLQRGDDVDDLVEEGLALFPGNWSLVWLAGHRHLQRGRDAEAAGCFRALSEADPDASESVAYAGRLFGPETHAALGLALFRLGRYAESADAYATAEKLAPDSQEYRVKRMLAQSRAAASPAHRPSGR